MSKKVAVIGGGPGGYVAAIKAAQLGAQVTLAEEAKLGGTCLNNGCIPTKALLHVGEFYSRAKSNSVAGVQVGAVSIDWPQAQRHKEDLIGRLAGGVSSLLRHNGIELAQGKARLSQDGKVMIGAKAVEADAVILATGSLSVKLNFPGADLPGVIDSTDALSLSSVPKSIVIIGGGVIGVEFATLFNWLGAKVTVIEMLPHLLPALDLDIADYIRGTLESCGVEVHTQSLLTGVTKDAGLTASFDKGGMSHKVTADYVLVAAGRKPNIENLGLEGLGIKMVGGAIEVDENFRTSAPGIYAVGDCNGQNLLAHAAMAQGIAAAMHIMGAAGSYNPNIIPSCVYSCPEIASVGMTEKQAIDAGISYRAGLFSLAGNAKSLIDDAGGGFIKIIADKNLGEVLGVHIAASRATEMIAEMALCMSIEGTLDDIINTIHSHPTVSEAVPEAAMSVFGKALHGI